MINILITLYLLYCHLLMLWIILTFALNSFFIQRILTAIFKARNIISSIFFYRTCPLWFFNHHSTAKLSIMNRIIIFILTKLSNMLKLFTNKNFTTSLVYSSLWWIVFCCWSSIFWFIHSWVIVLIS